MLVGELRPDHCTTWPRAHDNIAPQVFEAISDVWVFPWFLCMS